MTKKKVFSDKNTVIFVQIYQISGQNFEFEKKNPKFQEICSKSDKRLLNFERYFAFTKT